jgi:hypothetical protein
MLYMCPVPHRVSTPGFLNLAPPVPAHVVIKLNPQPSTLLRTCCGCSSCAPQGFNPRLPQLHPPVPAHIRAAVRRLSNRPGSSGGSNGRRRRLSSGGSRSRVCRGHHPPGWPPQQQRRAAAYAPTAAATAAAAQQGGGGDARRRQQWQRRQAGCGSPWGPAVPGRGGTGWRYSRCRYRRYSPYCSRRGGLRGGGSCRRQRRRLRQQQRQQRAGPGDQEEGWGWRRALLQA